MISKKVSLILTTYNAENNLKKTLDSIENQDYFDIEVIIKDGNSNDSTWKIIQEYQGRSKYVVKAYRCHDKGIYDAMNRKRKII